MKSSEEARVDIPDEPLPASTSPLKWVIVIVLCILGPITWLGVFLLAEPLHESQAKLLIKYVVERTPEQSDIGRGAHRDGDSIVAAEVEILTSWDVAMHVAGQIGPERLVPGSPGGEDATVTAAKLILSGLEVERAPESSLLKLRFRCADPDLAVDTLEALIEGYFQKHLDIHRPDPGRLGMIAAEAERVRSKLRKIEDELLRRQEDPEADAAALQGLEAQYAKAREEDRLIQIALDKARIDESLDHSRIPSIAIVQRPSTPVLVREKSVVRRATILAIAGPVLGVLFSLVPMRRRA